MPYIKAENRHHIDKHIGRHVRILTPGDLNYAFTLLLDRYIQEHGLSYQHLNDVMGALEGAKMELYRRVIVPYETQKMLENGDVYTPRSPR